MKIRSRLLTLAVVISAVFGLAMTASAAADRELIVDGKKDVKAVSATGEVTSFPPTLIQGWDNIGWSHLIIVSLVAEPCDASLDVDYAIRDLGNNNNQLSSIQLNPASNCILELWDGPNFTGENHVTIPLGSGGCQNLGSCFGHNIWKRVNSLQLK
jgi:hypothetical protein